MMAMYLLDTHVLLWAAEEKKELSERALQILSDHESVIFASTITAWEIFIKAKLGKLRSVLNGVQEFEQGLLNLSARLLPVTLAHCHAAANLPLHHRDPFDRLLIAQAKTEHLTLITNDPAIAQYDVARVW
jgi:PIN domain nuclease of toxin-antitoxin system